MKTITELPFVSLVILNFNGREHLEACLGSVVGLDYPKERVEVNLCDNGSTDDSVEFVRENFPTVHIIALDKNYGFAEGNNRAAAQATHEWVGFLNNDMRVERNWLQKLVEPLADQPGLPCLSSRIMSWNGTAIDFVGSGMNFQGFGFQLDFGLKQSAHDVARRLLSPCGGAMLIKRRLFLEIGGFDPDYFGFYEDADLGWRLNLLGHDVWYTPAAVAYHRHHGTYKRFPDYKLRVLYERNAMATIYKCLDDENLAATLPVAIMLLNEKALKIADLDQGPFEIAGGRRVAPAAIAQGPAVPGLRAKTRRVFREQGVRPLLRKSLAYARRYGERLVKRSQRLFLATAVPVPQETVSHYMGLGEFAHSLDDLTRKRQWLQQRRVRSDAELLPLFHFALEPTSSDPEYERFHHWLCRVMGIEQRFRAGEDPPERN